jgi:hypothetical protein
MCEIRRVVRLLCPALQATATTVLVRLRESETRSDQPVQFEKCGRPSRAWSQLPVDAHTIPSRMARGGGSDGSVPEPTSIALLSLGALAIVFRRRTQYPI